MADTSLFSRLKRLFSTNVIVRNVGGKKLKKYLIRVEHNHIQEVIL